jgi:hypothetical protein
MTVQNKMLAVPKCPKIATFRRQFAKSGYGRRRIEGGRVVVVQCGDGFEDGLLFLADLRIQFLELLFLLGRCQL